MVLAEGGEHILSFSSPSHAETIHHEYSLLMLLILLLLPPPGICPAARLLPTARLLAVVVPAPVLAQRHRGGAVGEGRCGSCVCGGVAPPPPPPPPPPFPVASGPQL